MRIDYHEHAEITRPMRALSEAATAGTLEPALLELVKVRASQLNGCAHCLEMHTKDARAMDESDDRLHLVAACPAPPARQRALAVAHGGVLALASGVWRLLDAPAQRNPGGAAHGTAQRQHLARRSPERPR